MGAHPCPKERRCAEPLNAGYGRWPERLGGCTSTLRRRTSARTFEGDGRTDRRRFRREACGAWRAGRAGPAPAMGILEKISEIEKEIARTQKNKGSGWGGRGG